MSASDTPPTNRPSLDRGMVVSLSTMRIAVVVGTSAVPVDCALDYNTPAVTGTPRYPRSRADLANDMPST